MQRVQNPREEKENEPVRRSGVSKGAGSLQLKRKKRSRRWFMMLRYSAETHASLRKRKLLKTMHV
jgi:hypothetical protein